MRLRNAKIARGVKRAALGGELFTVSAEQCLDMSAPKLERRFDFLRVVMILINLHQWIGRRAALVIERKLGHRQRHTEPRESVRESSAQIVISPFLKVRRFYFSLRLGMAAKSFRAITGAEHELALALDTIKHSLDRRRDRDGVRLAILGA